MIQVYVSNANTKIGFLKLKSQFLSEGVERSLWVIEIGILTNFRRRVDLEVSGLFGVVDEPTELLGKMTGGDGSDGGVGGKGLIFFNLVFLKEKENRHHCLSRASSCTRPWEVVEG